MAAAEDAACFSNEKVVANLAKERRSPANLLRGLHTTPRLRPKPLVHVRCKAAIALLSSLTKK